MFNELTEGFAMFAEMFDRMMCAIICWTYGWEITWSDEPGDDADLPPP